MVTDTQNSSVGLVPDINFECLGPDYDPSYSPHYLADVIDINNVMLFGHFTDNEWWLSIIATKIQMGWLGNCKVRS